MSELTWEDPAPRPGQHELFEKRCAAREAVIIAEHWRHTENIKAAKAKLAVAEEEYARGMARRVFCPCGRSARILPYGQFGWTGLPGRCDRHAPLLEALVGPMELVINSPKEVPIVKNALRRFIDWIAFVSHGPSGFAEVKQMVTVVGHLRDSETERIEEQRKVYAEMRAVLDRLSLQIVGTQRGSSQTDVVLAELMQRVQKLEGKREKVA